jgi:hypothetical protein
LKKQFFAKSGAKQRGEHKSIKPMEEQRTLPSAIEGEKPKIQFITSNTYPQEAAIFFGSIVSARSVRLISQKTTERDSWWSELRYEITKNALSLNCTHILGYREIVSIYEDVMVLNVFGTAVKIKESKNKKESGKLANPQLTRHRTPAEISPSMDVGPLTKVHSN